MKHSINNDELPTPAIVSIGQNNSRKRIVERLQSYSVEFGKAIHPTAVMSDDVKMGEGSWIGAGTTIIQGVKIGKWCVVTKDIPDGYVAYGTPCHRVRLVNNDKQKDSDIE